MFAIREPYYLLLDVLDGEKESHLILADWLEEQGHLRIARQARELRELRKVSDASLRAGTSSRKRLEFALSILPHRTVARLACEFALNIADDRAKEFLGVIYRWLHDQASNQEVGSACALLYFDREEPPEFALQPSAQDRIKFNRTASELKKAVIEVVENYREGQICEQQDMADGEASNESFDAGTTNSRPCYNRMRYNACETAKYARAFSHLSISHRPSDYELIWQKQRTRAVLKQLLDE